MQNTTKHTSKRRSVVASPIRCFRFEASAKPLKQIWQWTQGKLILRQNWDENQWIRRVASAKSANFQWIDRHRFPIACPVNRRKIRQPLSDFHCFPIASDLSDLLSDFLSSRISSLGFLQPRFPPSSDFLTLTDFLSRERGCLSRTLLLPYHPSRQPGSFIWPPQFLIFRPGTNFSTSAGKRFSLAWGPQLRLSTRAPGAGFDVDVLG